MLNHPFSLNLRGLCPRYRSGTLPLICNNLSQKVEQTGIKGEFHFFSLLSAVSQMGYKNCGSGIAEHDSHI